MTSSEIIRDCSTGTNLNWDEEELKQFKKLVFEDENLKCRTDDIFLLSFLRAKKFHRKKAFILLKNYYEVRRRIYKDVFTNLTPSSVSKCLNDKIVGYLPNTDQNGRVIGVLIVRRWDHNTVSPLDVLRTMIIGNDLLLNEHLLQVNGLTCIIDANDVTLRQVFHATPRMILLAVSALYKSCPIRYKEFHIINNNRLVKIAFGLVFPFLPYKVKKRIYIHNSDFSTLHKFIDPKYLPSDFGGELSEYDPTHFYEKMKLYQSFFEENEKYWKN
ncbi:clavesin-2-like isoform X1 [Centruroides vittatus]|uniref:clavesin-2-like isoform X1 n=1 Tax=Centruroides vittatus TaxID=120091 RepID=UPI00350ED88E